MTSKELSFHVMAERGLDLHDKRLVLVVGDCSLDIAMHNRGNARFYLLFATLN
jgi:hypothetical protein